MVKRLLVVASLLAAVACGSTSNPSPTAPTPVDATVSALAVTATPPSAGSFRLKSTATLSDGTSKDVTTSTVWESSDRTRATVSAAGVVTIVESGDVTFQGTYLAVVAALRMAVVQTRFKVFGSVSPVFPNQPRYLPGVRVDVVSGLDTGMFAVTDASGNFEIAGLRSGILDLRAQPSGYSMWTLMGIHLEADQNIDATLFPVPPVNASGERATAQCNDATWTWSQTTDRICFGHGGVAWGVCPGPICDALKSSIR
jgi:hypothetical protein